MYLLSQLQAQKFGLPVSPTPLKLMGERLRRVRRLKHYEAALRDCMDIVWDDSQSFSPEEIRVAGDVLKDLARAWATCSLSLKDLRRLEASRHLHD